MDISQKANPIRSRPVFIRLTPDLYQWVTDLCEETGHSFATIVRAILAGAREEGVSVIPNPEAEMPTPKRRRRRRVIQDSEPQATSA